MGVGSLPIADLLSNAASSSLPGNSGVNPQALTSMQSAPLQPPPPIPIPQPPTAQQQQPNSFPSVGARKRSDTKAMFSSIAQMVKSGGDYVQAKKNRMLQMNIERLLYAQQGLEEAKANPNDPKSKEAIAKNTAIINDITADPKLNKQLQKAFNIDIFGGGKNKNENKALIEAWKSYGEKQQQGDKSALNPIAQKLMSSQPMRQQMNPQAQQQAQMIAAGLQPKADEVLKANMEALKIQTEANTAEKRLEGQQQAAQVLADARKYGADKQVDAANVRALGQQQAAMIRFKADTIKTNAMLKAVDSRIDAMKTIAGVKTGDKTVGNLLKESNIIKGRAADLAKKRKDIEDQLNKYTQSSGIYGKIAGAVGMGEKSSMTKEQSDQLQKDLFTLKLEQNSVEGQWKDIQMRTNAYVKMGQMSDPDTMADPENLFSDDEN
jgi:hypothetical protein